MMSQRLTALPLPTGDNLYAALRLLVERDPVAGVFARTVLQAFACYPATERAKQLCTLLDLWDTEAGERTLPVYDPAVIEAARQQRLG